MTNQLTDPGFLAVMQNMAMKSPTPFAKSVHLGDGVNEDTPETDGPESLKLVFSPEVTEQLTEIAANCGFNRVSDFIITATSVYGQMMGAALEEGYTKAVLVNPESGLMIQVPLVKDDESPE